MTKILCNVMRLYNQLRDRFNLIRTILYFLKINLSLVIRYLTYLIFSVNLLNQLFDQFMQSTFFIN